MEQLYNTVLYLCDLRSSLTVHSGAPLKEAAIHSMAPTEHWDSLRLFDGSVPSGRIGQLSFKEEAAGKVRVFAMVDIWTQSVLKPLHDAISDILRSLPNDGTFDQAAAVKRCFAKVKSSGFSYGYDLSAATDRLPISLQVSVLSAIFGSTVGLHWKKLLVERDYWWKDVIAKGHEEHNVLRYAVGQPMGALSSFNMLALTHHLIVQSCALRASLSEKGV